MYELIDCLVNAGSLLHSILYFFFNVTATTEIYTYLHTLSLHDARPIGSSRSGSWRHSHSGTSRSTTGRSFAGTPALRKYFCASTSEATCDRSEEHTSELQSLMRISYAVFCLKKKKKMIKLNRNKSINVHQKNRQRIDNKLKGEYK